MPKCCFEKSLVKITSLVHNCRMVQVYTMDKLVRMLGNFGITVSNQNRSRPCKQHLCLFFGLGKHVRRTNPLSCSQEVLFTRPTKIDVQKARNDG